MKQKIKLVSLIICLAILLTSAYFAYRYFSSRYTPQQLTDRLAETEAESFATDDAEDLAPDCTVFDKDNKENTLSSHIGKPVVVNFWATWCPPCKAELPAYQSLFERYGDSVDFMMVAMTDDYSETKSSVDTFVAENSYTFPLYYDLHGPAYTAYAVTSIPVSVFIDANGHILHSQIGAMDEGTLETWILSLLKE